MSTRASNHRGLSSGGGGGGHSSARAAYKASPATIDSSSGSSATSGAEEPLSPRLKEAEAAESLSSLRNLMPQRSMHTTDPLAGVPPMPPSMSRCPSSRDAYEPAPSLRRAGSNSGPVMPSLARSTSQPGINNGRPFFLSDWRASVTVEERQEVRRKIQAAYANQSHSYDDLVELVTSVEEEFLHMCSPSRLDYIKNSVQYDKRLAEKKRQLRGDVDSLSGDLASSTSASSATSTSTSTSTSTGGNKGEGKEGGRRAEAGGGGKEEKGTKRTKVG